SLYRAVEAAPVAGPRELIERIAAVSSSGLPRVVVFPFVALARPMFAEWPGGFLLSLVMASLVLAATTAWVLQSDATFEAATEEAARGKESSARGGKAKYRARASGWTLATTGRPEMIFAWKCAMQTFRIV